jgi:hypothetical protein
MNGKVFLDTIDSHVLLSEHLSHGQTYGCVRCENPFHEH